MSITITDLKNGIVARVKLPEFAKLAGISCSTLYRKIKAKELVAVEDPTSGRIYVPAKAAVDFLVGRLYMHDHQNVDAIATMERARAAKQNKSKSA